jgi:hypothetical protein
VPSTAPNAALAPTAAGSVVEIKNCAGGMKPAAGGLVDDLEECNNRSWCRFRPLLGRRPLHGLQRAAYHKDLDPELL